MSLMYGRSVLAEDERLRVSQDLWPPYIVNSAYGSGIAYDLVTGALDAAEFEFDYTVKPWSRVLKETLGGQNDVIIAIWKTEQREKDYLLTDSYMNNRMVFVSRSDTKFEYESLESLKGMRVALINDYAYAGNLRQYPDMIPINSLDLANSIRQVLTQRADVLVTDEAVGRWAVQEMRVGKGKLYFSRSHLDSTPLHAAVRRDHPHAQEIVSKLNQYFKENAKIRLQDIKIKYGLTD
ncbi:transporter substrate-binding domain-containing protein [Vibrio sp. OCN044]|uniref:Transporter substrate-binding domain-containing protein n=2 Tax=Vibrio tetraodonis TaxID=2231647 RepID=A0A6L8LPZ7_9VIBR|nr:transporter substrate-binding domain-containing protein [Vibrio tetraodonis subsp. pristinus]